jgi:hypothetical protein
MSGRSALSELWGDDDENEYSQQQIIDDYERMQRAQTQTIAHFTPSPPRAQRGRVPAPPPADGGAAFISLEARYRADYNRDMNSRRADWEDTDDDEEPQSESESSSSDENARSRSARDGSSAGSGDSSDEESDSEESTQSPRSSPSRNEPRPPREERRADPPRPHREPQQYDTTGRPECFLCAWGNRFHDGIAAPHVVKLNAILKESYGVHANHELARELHLYFKRHIYRPRAGMTMLTTACALEHIEQLHTLNARIFLGEMIRDEKMMYFAFKNAVWRQDGSWDRHAVKEYRESKKELRQLYAMPLARMNFTDGDTVEDQKRAAGYMHLLTRFDATGGKQAGKKKVTSTPFRI